MEIQELEGIQVGSRYRHYKGKEYIVRGFVRDSDSLEMMVLYEAQYECELEGRLWVRFVSEWSEYVEVPELQYTCPRFILMS